MSAQSARLFLLPQQASPVRPQSPGAAPKAPEAEPAPPPRAKPAPPPPLLQPKGRLGVQQAARLSTELEAAQRGQITPRAPVEEVRASFDSHNSIALRLIQMSRYCRMDHGPWTLCAICEEAQVDFNLLQRRLPLLTASPRGSSAAQRNNFPAIGP